MIVHQCFIDSEMGPKVDSAFSLFSSSAPYRKMQNTCV